MIPKRSPTLDEVSQTYTSHRASTQTGRERAVAASIASLREGPLHRTHEITEPPAQKRDVRELSSTATTLAGIDEESLSRIIRAIEVSDQPPVRDERFILLQKWEGYVLERRAESFLARVSDLFDQEPDLEVELALTELPVADLPYVEEGAYFDWNIWYVDTDRGGRERRSTISFRRLPSWRRDELETAKRRAAERRERLGWK